MIPVALGVLLLGGGGIFLFARRGKMNEMLQDIQEDEQKGPEDTEIHS